MGSKGMGSVENKGMESMASEESGSRGSDRKCGEWEYRKR